MSRRDETGQSAGAKKTTQTMNSTYNNKNRVFNNNRNSNGGRYYNQANRNQNNLANDEDWGSKDVQTPTTVNKNQPQVKQDQPSPKPNVNAAETKPKPLDVPTVNTTPNLDNVKTSEMTNGVKGPGSLKDVMFSKKIVPKNYLIELLSVGDSVLLSVDSNGADCRSNRPGFVCLSMHEKFETEYQNLCEVYVVDCENEKENYTPKPGESFSYLNAEDGGWYRARSLTSSLAALIDSCKLVTIKQTDKLKILPAKYEQYPEFCCLLNASAVKLGDNLKCTILSKSPDACKVSLENVETGASVGEGEVSRWLPTVEYPQKVAVNNTSIIQPQIPEVPRPDVVNNSKVLLVDATAIDRAFVRPADIESQKKFDNVLQDVVLYGRNASPLKEPPAKGQTVIGKFSDGLHYRALCKRTNVKQNKYLLEYIEFGNIEITPLENIYECPSNLSLSTLPSEVSLVTMQCKCNSNALTPPAVEYLDKLKDGSIELNLTIPSGAKTAASGSAVCLTLVKNNESVNRKIEEMCTPEWKKMEERGADVVEAEWLMYSDLEYLELPANGCSLDILDVSAITAGTLSVCQQGLPHAANILTDLTRRMGEYCDSELGKEPYLPKNEELCIARCPPYPQWFRAVLLTHSPGDDTANVCYLDYGNIESVPVSMLRKMLPEFVRGQPALATHVEIRNFPKQVTEEMLCRAVKYMEINDDGRGKLTVVSCEKQDPGMYMVEAPGLIAAMLGK